MVPLLCVWCEYRAVNLSGYKTNTQIDKQTFIGSCCSVIEVMSLLWCMVLAKYHLKHNFGVCVCVCGYTYAPSLSSSTEPLQLSVGVSDVCVLGDLL